MWIVRLALNRPYTFVVIALMILLVSPVVILRTPTDIFPDISIPVASVVWSYAGMSAQQMAARIVTPSERGLTTTVNDIEHIESQSLNGIAVIKVFFHPNVKIDMAIAQITAICQASVRSLPPGITPPLIITYNASSVPILQLSLSSKTLSEAQVNDLGANFLRVGLATVQGAAMPNPYGGKMREIMVDIDTSALNGKGLSPSDVVNAIGAENLILPAGTEKIGDSEYAVELNGSPDSIKQLNDIPLKEVNGHMIYIRDVAHVRDGFAVQQNIVRSDGVRASLLTIIKSGAASTLDIVDRIKKAVPQVAKTLPKGLEIRTLLDQSLFVRAAVQSVIREAVIAACLTALMILIFLGNWRTTFVIVISIPLAILCSIITLSALGETMNIMTLGGLALAVGILVDDATVEIENIERNLRQGKELRTAILDGAAQIAVPAFVSTLCICIVFVPMFFLTGTARYLFVPLAEAVVFAMLASYILSRTVVPTLVMYFLRHHVHDTGSEAKGWFGRFHAGFESGFERLRNVYRSWLNACLHHRRFFAICFLGFCVASCFMTPFLGQDFFPKVDAGQMRLHVRAKTGTRVEETAVICDHVEELIRRTIPRGELESIVDNIGLPTSGINTSYNNGGTIGPFDAEILISLNQEKHHPTQDYIRKLRRDLNSDFPGVSFFFQPADIVSQVLNFGLPSPIDIQVVGHNQVDNYHIANDIARQLRRIPGAVDVHVQQAFDLPSLQVATDRTKVQEVGFTQRDVASSLLVALSGSFQTAPSFYLNPANGVTYQVVSQVPQYHLDTLQALADIPVTGSSGAVPQLLGNLATVSRGSEQDVVSHYNIQPVIDVYGDVQGRDLGGVAKDFQKIVSSAQKKLPRGSSIIVRGQVQTMKSSFVGLGFGLLFAIALVYLLIVINFQSWSDPFIIITALPGALCGIVWMLFLTRTTLNVPSLMGAVMSIGVATANSILVVTFAKERLEETGNAFTAALDAGYIRLRPVTMTALAMIIGMVPMALGLGEGGEQNAPLGRAVIGGLLFATVATLFFVPVIFCLIRGKTADKENGQTT
ncbi:MAG TPA: efflux RND transporter permease subunit [Verrucomicrobiae bacterium]|jgi:CzcA family heavy metal efflux pump|nr:efflux RND transporter permease subunit [Verrucomicrobiae bacterium]